MKSLSLRELLNGVSADRLMDAPIADIVSLGLLALFAFALVLALLSYIDHKFLK